MENATIQDPDPQSIGVARKEAGEASPPMHPLALLLQEDDDVVRQLLPRWVKPAPYGPNDDVFWQSSVQERVCAMQDAELTALLLTLAHIDYLGPDLLFDERLMPRFATMNTAHLLGTFLPAARTIPGFKESAHEWNRMVRDGRAARGREAQQGLHPITAPELDAMVLPPLTYIVDDILPAGATLFVGKAKDGKSLAMWNICIAVATGGVVFGHYPARQGSVLYMALEDGARRAQKRLRDQMQMTGMPTAPTALEFVLFDAPRLGEGLEEELVGWLERHGDAKLIVIDILEKVRPQRAKHGSVYQEDYMALAPLQRLAQERGIALVVVHHANKAKVTDFRESISGSMSLAGAADTLWVLQRLAGEADAALKITGRDIETLDLAMQFADGFWTAVGDAAAYRMSTESREVLEAIQQAGMALAPKQLATLLGVKEGTMRVRLSRMAERGDLLPNGQGAYSVPGMATMEVQAPGTPVMHCNGVMTVTPVTLGENEPVATAETGGVTGATALQAATLATGITASRPLPPAFCPGCGVQACWLDRGTYFRCSRQQCGFTWLPPTTGETTHA